MTKIPEGFKIESNIPEGFTVERKGQFTPEPFTQTEQDNTPGLVSGGSQSFLQGATLGFADEIQSVIAAAVAAPFISDKTFGQLMMDARKSFREQNDAFKKENPRTALGLELAGGLTTGGLAGGGKVAGAKSLGGAIVQGAETGAAIGAVAGAGYADAENLFSEETLNEAIKGGTIGALLGGATPIVLKGLIQAGKAIPKALPESMLETSIKIRPSVPDGKRANMIRTALDEGIMPTTKGLEKIGTTLAKLDKGLNKIIDDATAQGKTIPAKALFTELKQLRNDLGGVNLRANKNLSQIDEVAKNFYTQLQKIGKKTLTPREVQDLKRSAYKQLKFDVNQLSAQYGTTEAEKAVIRGGKKSLETIDPAVQQINRREGNLLELGDELERAVSRLNNRNFISLDTAAKVAAGGASGGPAGTAAGVLASVLGAPRVKAKTALILENIRRTGELSAQINKTLSPEAAAAFSILVQDNKDSLTGLLDTLSENK